MRTPDEIKNKIIEWCKEDNITIKIGEIGDSSGNLWEIGIGKLAIYIQKRLPDRVYFQQEFRLTEEQKTLLNKIGDQKKRNMIGALNNNSISLDYENELLSEKDGKVLTGVRLHKFTSTNLSKIKFLHTILRVQKIGTFTNTLLGNTIGVEMNIAKSQENQNDSSSVGIQ